jgi:hypothetical protein
LTGRTEENHSKSHSEWLTSRARFELRIDRMHIVGWCAVTLTVVQWYQHKIMLSKEITSNITISQHMILGINMPVNFVK